MEGVGRETNVQSQYFIVGDETWMPDAQQIIWFKGLGLQCMTFHWRNIKEQITVCWKVTETLSELFSSCCSLEVFLFSHWLSMCSVDCERFAFNQNFDVALYYFSFLFSECGGILRRKCYNAFETRGLTSSPKVAEGKRQIFKKKIWKVLPLHYNSLIYIDFLWR